MARQVRSVSLLAVVTGILAGCLAAPSAALAQSNSPLYWNTASGTGVFWSTAAKWWTTPTGTVSGSAAGASNDAVFDGSSVNGATIVQLNAGASADGLYFNNTGTTLLEGATTSETLTIGTDGVTVASTAGVVTLGSTTTANLMPISIIGSETWTNNSTTSALNVISAISETTSSTLSIAGAGNTTISGVVSNGTGTLALTKSGTGKLTLSAATFNTYTGATCISGGVLSVSKMALGGAASGIGQSSNDAANLVLQGGTLQYTGAATTTDRLFTINAGGGTLDASGTGAINWSNTGTIVSNDFALTLTGTSTLANTLAASLTGASSLTKLGAGTWVLTGTNSYSGTTISAGTLEFAKTLAMPASGTVAVGAGGTLAVNAGGTGEFTNDSTNTAGSIGGLLAGTGGQGAPVTFAPGSFLGIDTTNAGGSLTYAGDITNTGLGLTKLGTGTLVFTGTSTSTGATTITAGTLQIGNGLSTGSLNSSALADNGALVYDVSSTATLAFAITGTGSFTQMGSGTTNLTGANTYSGTTSVTGGTLALVLPSSSSTAKLLGNTAITVSSGATLAVLPGIGSINSGVTIGSLGASLTLASGSIYSMVDGGAGLFNLNKGSGTNLTLQGATLNFDVGVTGTDVLKTNKIASISGTNTINLTPFGSLLPVYGAYYPFEATSSFTGAGTFQFSNGQQTENLIVGGKTYTATLSTQTPSSQNFTAEAVTIVQQGNTLTWTGQVNGTGAQAATWDVGTSTNWANTNSTPGAVAYSEGSNVAFTDFNAVLGPGNFVNNMTVTIQSGGVTPAAVSFNGDFGYIITNISGPIQGAATTMTFNGGATTSILNSVNNYGVNTYGGGTWISGTAPDAGAQIGGSSLVVGGVITQGPLGTGTINLTGGSLSDDGGIYTVANNIVISANASLWSASSGTLILDGTNLTIPATVSLSNNPVLNIGSITIINDVVTGNSNLTVTASSTHADLYLNALNTYSGSTTVNDSGIKTGVLSVSNLAIEGTLGGVPSGIGESSNAAANLVLNDGILQYTGTGGTTDRLFTVGPGGNGQGVNGGTLDSSGTGPIVWSNPGAIVSIFNSVFYPLTLAGSNTGANTLTPILTGTSTLTKSGVGTWFLAGSNTTTGATTISGGILAVTAPGQLYANSGSNTSSIITVNSTGTLEVDRWDIGGLSGDSYAAGAGSFGNLAGQKTQLVINGGTIMYTGSSNNSTPNVDTRGFTIGTLGATLDSATAGQTWYVNLATSGTNIIASTSGLLTLNGPGNGVLAGAIPTGTTGGLTMSGGTWTLTAANQYTGATTLNAGTLVMGNSAAFFTSAVTLNTPNNGLQFASGVVTASLGSLAGGGNIVLQNNAGSPAAVALTVGGNNSTTANYSGSLSGPGSLTMNSSTGAGIFTLSGASSYTGTTTVTKGQLTLASTASLGNTAISVANGATFAPQAGSGTIFAGSTGSAGAGATLNLAGGAIFSMTDAAVGTFQLQQGSGFGSNALTLGGTTTLNFDLNGSVSQYQLPAVDLLAASGTASVSGINTINLTLITPGVLNPGGPINLITAANFTGGGTFQLSPASANMNIGGVPYVLTLNNTPTALTLTIISNGPTVTWTGLANGTGAAASTWDLSTTSNWATSANVASTFFTGDTVIFNDTNAVTSAPVTNGTINIQSDGVSPTAVSFDNSSVNYTISPTSGPIKGAATLSKSGTALLSIQNLNIYARGTTLSGGTLRFTQGTHLSGGSILNGPFGSGTLSLSGGTLDNGNPGSVTLANNIAITADSTLTSSASGALVFDGIGLTAPATVVLSNNPMLTVNNTTTINDVISGSGQSLTVAGSGTLILGAANTYSGITTISSGTLQLGNGATNGSVAGDITDDSALVIATTGSPSYATAISGSGSVAVNGSGTLTLSGGNSFQGGLTVNGSSSLVVALSGANTYSGGTLIQSGTLRAGAANTLPATGSVTFGGVGLATGTLDLNGYDLAVGGLFVASGATGNAANQIITNSNTSGNGSTATLTYNGTSPNEFAGTLKDGSGGNLLALTVSSGNLTLTGTNTYTGATAVNGGTLQVASPGSLASAVTVNSPATLSGSGTISGLVTVNSGGILAPSGIAGAATTTTLQGSLTLANGAVLDFNLSTPGSGDAVNVTGGTLSLGTTGGVLNINYFGGGGELQIGSYPLIFASSITGNASAWMVNDHDGDSGHSYSFTDTGGQFDLVVSVPGESGTWKTSGPSSAAYGTGGNWSSGAVPDGAGLIATFGSGTTHNITFGGSNYVVGELNFDNPNVFYRLGSDFNGSLTLNNSGSGASVVASNGASPTIATTLVLADSSQTTTFNIDSSSFVEIAGPINESSPVGQAIVLSGGGALQLDNATNAYTGGTTVNDGMLTLDPPSGSAAPLGTGPLAINGSSVVNVSPLDTAVITIGSLSGTGNGQLNVASNATLTVNQTTSSEFDGTLALNGGLVLAGGSGKVLTISGAPTLTAGSSITVSSGTLALTNNTAAPATVTGSPFPTVSVAPGATLQLAGAQNVLSSDVHITTQGSGSAGDGAVTVVGASTQTVGVISGDMVTTSPVTTYAGNTTVGDGTDPANLTATQILQNTLTINAGSTLTIASSGGVSMDAAVAVAGSGVATSSATADNSAAGSDPITAIQAAIASGAISSVKGQQLENRIAAIERLAATDPGLDVSLLEDRVLAALPSPSVWTSSGTSPLTDSGSGLLAVDGSALASASDAASSSGIGDFDFGGSPAAVPEPSSLLLATMAGIGILVAIRRRRV